MSAASEAHPQPHDAHDSHDAAHDGHAAFDGEPTNTLPADEPRTPGWLPLVGLALFALGGFALFGGDLAAPPVKAVEIVAPQKPIATVVPPGGVLRPPPPAAAPARPPTPGAGNAVKAAIERDPEKVKEVNRRLMEKRDALQAAPAAPPPPR
jgi:hypothetical protein